MNNALLAILRFAFNRIGTSIQQAIDVLQGNFSNDYTIQSLFNDVTLNVADLLKPFAWTIISICILLEITNTLTRSGVDIMKWETGLRLGVKVVFAKVAIDLAPLMLMAIFYQAGEWIGALGTGIVDFGENIYDSLEPVISSTTGTMQILGLYGSTIVMALAIVACGLIIVVMAYARLFEILMHVAVSPIPVAFMPLGNGDGSGFSRTTGRFFKSFSAACLQGVMMLTSIRIFGLIMSGITSGMVIHNIPERPPGAPYMPQYSQLWYEYNAAMKELTEANIDVINETMFVMLVGSIVLVVAIMKSSTWSKTILDAA